MLTRTVTALAIALATLGGCDTIQSDFSQFADSFSQPTPAEAAQWAADPNDRENARRGTVLLANAPWGGAAPYLKMYRLYAEDSLDPLVRAAALQALGRHGDAADAPLVAKSLASPFRQVRLAAAKALQRRSMRRARCGIWRRATRPTRTSSARRAASRRSSRCYARAHRSRRRSRRRGRCATSPRTTRPTRTRSARTAASLRWSRCCGAV
jgi:hypothetical protein